MFVHEILIFTIVSGAYLAIPGVTVVYIVNEALVHGWKAVPPSVTGAALANALYFVIAFAGVSSLALTSKTGLEILHWIGVVVLLWFAWHFWRAPVSSEEPEASVVAYSRPIHALFWRSFVLNMLNPKKIVYLTAIIPHIFSYHKFDLERSVVLLLIFTGLSVVVYGGYVVVAAVAAPKLAGRKAQRIAQKISAVIFLAAAIAIGVNAATS